MIKNVRLHLIKLDVQLLTLAKKIGETFHAADDEFAPKLKEIHLRRAEIMQNKCKELQAQLSQAMVSKTDARLQEEKETLAYTAAQLIAKVDQLSNEIKGFSPEDNTRKPKQKKSKPSSHGET